jgi:hypothetical protein
MLFTAPRMAGDESGSGIRRMIIIEVKDLFGIHAVDAAVLEKSITEPVGRPDAVKVGMVDRVEGIVIRYPLMTKKISTPKKPPLKIGYPA